MFNQRKLFVSLIMSLLLVVGVTVVAADDASLPVETAAQDTGVALCMDEDDLQEPVPLSESAVTDSEVPLQETEPTKMPEPTSPLKNERK